MSSIRDVADLAGVSVATVSRALRDLPRVSDDTRARVRLAARELGYVASASASGLASGRTTTVGIVVPYVTRWFFSSVITGAEQVLTPRGYDLLLYELGGSEQARTRLFEQHLARKRVDGLLVLSLQLTVAEVARLQHTGLAAVVVGGATPGLASVGIDDVAAASAATEHLLGLGHRRIAFVGSQDSDTVSSTPRDRRRGYRRALLAAGTAWDPTLDVDGDFTVRGGTRAGYHLLAMADPPTAIVAASDEMAMGCLYAARRAGVRVPDQLSVVGIDDHELAEVMDLTTVAQPVTEQGRIAAELLLPRMAGTLADGSPDPSHVVRTRLVLRGTTGPARTAALPLQPSSAV